MKTSDERNELAKAMSLAQKEMRPAIKDASNPHFKSKFSTLTSTWEALREPLTNNALTVWQDVVTADKSVSIITLVVHSSGQWAEFGPLSLPVIKCDAQGFGSAISYGKRYALQAAFGIVSDDDDDGNAACLRQPAHQPQSKPQSSVVSKEQAQILQQMLTKTPIEYRNNVKSYMEKQNISSIYHLTPADYNGIMNNTKNCLEQLQGSYNDKSTTEHTGVA